MRSSNSIRLGRRGAHIITLRKTSLLRAATRYLTSITTPKLSSGRARVPSSSCDISGRSFTLVKQFTLDPLHARLFSTANRPAELLVLRYWKALISILFLYSIALLPLGLLFLPYGCYVLAEHSSEYLRGWRLVLEEQLAIGWLLRRETPTNVYSQLQNDEFRVMVLEPGAGDDEIACSLCVCKYGGKIPYQALSYAWGNPAKIERIRCNGQQWRIASNLYHALLNLRDPHRKKSFG